MHLKSRSFSPLLPTSRGLVLPPSFAHCLRSLRDPGVPWASCLRARQACSIPQPLPGKAPLRQGTSRGSVAVDQQGPKQQKSGKITGSSLFRWKITRGSTRFHGMSLCVHVTLRVPIRCLCRTVSRPEVTLTQRSEMKICKWESKPKLTATKRP